MPLAVVIHQRQVSVRGEGSGGRTCRVGIAHAHHQQEHHQQGVLVKAAACVRRILPLIRGRGGGDLLFRHIQIVLVDIPGGLRDHDLIPVAALANDLHLRTPEQMPDHRVFHAGAGAEVQVGVAADIDCANGNGLCRRLRSGIGISIGIGLLAGVLAGIAAHQGLHDLLHALGGKGDLPVLADRHTFRQDDLRAEGGAIGQGGAVSLHSVPGSPVRSSGGCLHSLCPSGPLRGNRGIVRRKAHGGEVPHHQNARQKAGDQVIDLHALYPP